MFSIEALFVVFVLLAVVVCVMACVRILREYERAVVFTLGRFERVTGPGLVLIVRCCGCEILRSRLCLSPSSEYIPILACASPYDAMRRAMAQEAIMKWSQIEASWKQLKGKFAFRPFGLSDDDRESFDLIEAEISRAGQNDESQSAALRPDDRGRRSEFSLHIGC